MAQATNHRVELPDQRSGKTVQIEGAHISVSANDRVEERYVALLNLPRVKFYRGRKWKVGSTWPYASGVHITPLYDHNGVAVIAPDDWRRFCRDLPVVPDKIHPYPVTGEIARLAREDEARLADAAERCAAEAEAYKREHGLE